MPLATLSRKNLTLQNIGDIDLGKVALAFNQALSIATQDVTDRPNDKGARTVTLQVVLKPVLDRDTGVLDVIDNQFIITKAMPAKKSACYPMLAMPDGCMTFEPNSPSDPRQTTFSFPPGHKTTTTEEDERVDTETGEVHDPK